MREGALEPALSLGLLGHSAHLGADVSQDEEGSCAGCADHFRHPEGCAPAVVLGNGAEGQPGQKATHCQGGGGKSRVICETSQWGTPSLWPM